MGFFSDFFGLSKDVATACVRAKYGWKPVGSSDYRSYDVALSAFKNFGTQKCSALNALSDDERRMYENLVRDNPDGYESYLKKREEERLAEEKRLEEMYPDPMERLYVTEFAGRHFPSHSRDEDAIARTRYREKREWDSLSASEKETQREAMRITGSYWGPEHVGEEYWLDC